MAPTMPSSDPGEERPAAAERGNPEVPHPHVVEARAPRRRRGVSAATSPATAVCAPVNAVATMTICRWSVVASVAPTTAANSSDDRAGLAAPPLDPRGVRDRRAEARRRPGPRRRCSRRRGSARPVRRRRRAPRAWPRCRSAPRACWRRARPARTRRRVSTTGTAGSRRNRHTSPSDDEQRAGGQLIRGWQHQTSRRPSIALCIVTSSAYSRSLPTGTPMAMRVTRTPSGLSSRAR